jgi:hypothetical protein
VVYANDEGTQVTKRIRSPGRGSEDFHTQVAADKINEGYQFLDFTP